MKVLKQGNGAKSWSKKVKCTGLGNGMGGCGAVLLVEKADLFQTYRSCMGRDEEWYTTFECPDCLVFTDIASTPFSASELPTHQGWKRKQNKAPKA